MKSATVTVKPVIVRLLLRYAAGILVAKGLLAPGMGDLIATDPDLLALAQVAAGIAAGAIAEVWYSLARRFGWPT